MSYSIELIRETTTILKNALKDKKLRIHPIPKEDESLTSWITRLAVSNGFTPYAFMSVHFKPFYYLLRQDTDCSDKTDFFELLSYKTGIDIEKIKNLSLSSYDGILFMTDEKINKRPFLLYLTNRGGYNTTYGYRYCPFCLKEEEYLKKQHRLVFSTICLKHKIFLLDRCPKCNKPLSPFIWRNINTFHFHCPHCQYEYKDAVEYAEKVPEESKTIYYQEKIYKIIEECKFEFEDREYFSVLFFSVLNYLAGLLFKLENSNKNKTKINYDLLEKEKEIIKPKKSEGIKTISLYALTVKEHALLFTTAMDILSNRKNFDKFVKENSLNFSQLSMKNNKMYQPYWYERLINNYKKGRYVSTEEAKHAIEYLKKQRIKPSMRKLSKLFDSVLESRKRKDIKELLCISSYK